MRRPNREIEIFSISALDLFASAMGAFIVVAIVLFPFWQNTADEDQEERRRQLTLAFEQCQAAVASQEITLQTLEEGIREAEAHSEECEAQTSRTFLAIVMRWDTDFQDIDLHIVDPSGREYYYGQPTFPGSDAVLSVDDVDGPGIEAWEISLAPAGTYRIFYNLFDRHGNGATPTVSGTVYYRRGSQQLPDFRMSREMRITPVATVTVSRSGDVTINQ